MGGIASGLSVLARIALVVIAVCLLVFAGLAASLVIKGRPLDLGIVHFAGAPGQTSGLPEGAVIAVQADACPYPWQDFKPAAGRVVAGAGTTGNADANDELLPSWKPGETGGQRRVRLLAPDMPPHSHRLSIGGVLDLDGRALVPPPAGGGAAVSGIVQPYTGRKKYPLRPPGYIVDPLEPVGGIVSGDGRPEARRHDNMPPFVALRYCTNTWTLEADLFAAGN